MNYVLSRKAEEDIISIYLHGLEHFGEMQADAYHSKLEACFEFLARNPLSTPEAWNYPRRYEYTLSAYIS